MCGTKRLNPFFRLHEVSEVLNKYVMGVWLDDFNPAFSISFIVTFFCSLCQGNSGYSNMFMNWNNLFSECNEHV